MSDELKPCPFCGGEADVVFPEFEDNNHGTVMCMTCFATSPDKENWKEAVTAWNTRTDAIAPQQAAEVLLASPDLELVTRAAGDEALEHVQAFADPEKCIERCVSNAIKAALKALSQPQEKE